MRNKIWNLEEHKGKTALIDELGCQVTYDVLNEEAHVLVRESGAPLSGVFPVPK